MYQEQELQREKDAIRRRCILTVIPCVIMLGVMIWSLTVRMQWLTDVSCVLFLGMIVFFYELTIRPVIAYARHMDQMLHGITHDVECRFSSIDPDESLVENVRFRAIHVLCRGENPESEEYDRLFYYDALKPLPEFAPGQMVRVTYHDRQVADIRAV